MRALIFLIVLSLTACASSGSGTPDDTSFDIRQYFNQRIAGTGVIERNDKILSRFEMDVDASVVDDTLRLDERFSFEDGTDFRRVWTLDHVSPGIWRGGAENVVGETEIRVIDGVVNMRYLADFPYRDGMIRLRFNQKLFEMGDGVILNRSRLTKYGVPVGTVTVIFKPAAETP